MHGLLNKQLTPIQYAEESTLLTFKSRLKENKDCSEKMLVLSLNITK